MKRTLLLVLMSAVAVAGACGPTADALRPTLPPRSIAPGDGAPEPGASITAGQSVEPAASGSIPPGGIGDPLTGFPQGNAYEVTDVTTTPAGGLVAVGTAGTGQGYYGLLQGVVWRSDDGQTWQQTVDPALLYVTPNHVVANGDSVYLFGDYSGCSDTTGDECPDDPSEGTVVFRSTAGGAWEQLAQTTDMIGASISDVTTWDNTFVAWGAAADENATTTVWTSSDALTWKPTTDLAGLDPVDAVIVGGPGLIALGSNYVESIDDYKLAAATSTDGAHFTATSAAAVTGAMVTDATAGPTGFAAVGWAASEEVAASGLAVFSADAQTWTQASATDNSFDIATLIDVHATGNGYVAVGSTTTDELDYDLGGLWGSADGQSWRSLGDLGGPFNLYGASALTPSGLYVFTAYQEPSDEDETDMKSTIYGWFVPNDRLAP
jgi:hypothetical protein